MKLDLIDGLILLNIAASASTLFFSATKSAGFFRRILGGVSLLQMFTGGAVLILIARSRPIGEILTTFGEFSTGGLSVGAWIVTFLTFVFYSVAFAKILPSVRRACFPAYSLHRMTFWSTALLTFVAIPLVSASSILLLRGGTLLMAIQAASVLGIGYGALFLRLDLIRILALSSFAHRIAPVETEEKWNWWAFVFGVRWYFCRGLLLQGCLMMIPYVASLIPGVPQVLLPLTFLGTRIYAGLRGNHDYRKRTGMPSVDV